MSQLNFTNQVLNEPQFIPNVIDSSRIGAWQAQYLLSHVEFERIKRGSPKTKGITISLSLMTLGFALNVIAKVYPDYDKIPAGDLVGLSCGIGLTVIFFIIGFFIKDEKKLVMKNIEAHFEASAPQTQINTEQS
ncbi:hypothetical protein [Pseudoalteromonas rhizosphaerae]|uniref:hypothetical protein n=1 Tax=Pseudoalteromonas rhizosphaerae TaxID=2518973 RepID=UPI00384D80AA